MNAIICIDSRMFRFDFIMGSVLGVEENCASASDPYREL